MGKLNNVEEEKPKPKPKPDFSHFSHDHPLELTALCEADDRVLCSGCKTEIVQGRNYYSCRACCDYSLHHACYNMPRSLQHPADPNHDLELLLLPSFHCKACGSHGSGFSYSCSICHVHYHTSCTQLPPTKLHTRHHHTLELEFSPPYGNPKAFRCDICGTHGSDHWVYRCSRCEFDAHLNCADAAAPPKQQPEPQLQYQSPQVSASASSSASQAPIPLPAYNNVKAINAPQTTTQSAGYGNQNHIIHQNGSYMNQQHQVVQNPLNNGGYYTMSTSAASGTPMGLGPSGVTYAYHVNNPMQQQQQQPGWAYANQNGNYGYNNQGGYVRPGVGGMVAQPGMGYPNNQPGGFGAGMGGGGGGGPGVLGAGMGGLVAAGLFTGMGEAAGQGIIHCVTGGFGNDGPPYSDQNAYY